MSAVEERSLPKAVDAFKLCQQGMTLEGAVKAGDLPRLIELQAAKGSTSILHAALRFSRDEEGHRVVQGEMEAALSLVCQRCLDEMMYPVATEFHCAFVATDEEARKLPAHLEPVMLQPDSSYVNLHELLEDELLLNMPISALHERCDGDGSTKVFGEVKTEIPEKRQLPFAGLAELLKKE